MANVAVASTSTKAYASGSTIVIDKPTGLAVGNLMVAFVHKIDGDVGTCTLTGWTAIDSYDDTTATGDYMFSLYKIADSADVAASNFTFTLGETKVTGGAILRITNFNNINPVNTFAHGSDGTSNTNQIFSGGAITPSENGLILMAIFLDVGATMSGYYITNNNPTWAEVADFSDGGSNGSMALAWAYRPELTDTGNFGGTSNNAAKGAALMTAIGNAPITLTDTVSETDSTNSDLSSLVSDTVNDTDTVTTNENKWTNTDKSSSTWTNQDKS